MQVEARHTLLQMRDLAPSVVAEFLSRFDIGLSWVGESETIKGSFWGEPEAGIVGSHVYVRPDTPVHSFLHETSHVICMSPEVRASHEGNAGSDDLEESAVCFLQVVLADCLQNVGRERLMADMDDWGYSFRLGSTAAWFANDAEDARDWLLGHGLISDTLRPSFEMRSD